MPPRHLLVGCLAAAAGAGALAAAPAGATPVAPLAVARDAAPVVLTGAQLPAWSRAAAQGVAAPYPSGTGSPSPVGDGVRTAHNGRIVVPPDTRTGVDPDRIAAYRWSHGRWHEVPVQVDQRFPYFLANGRSSFSAYSGTDQELTYAWAPDAHDTGAESWKQMFGRCTARYARSAAEAQHAGFVTPGPQESFADYTRPMTDPVPTLDDDDEIAFMARDAGQQAPPRTAPPRGARDGQAVTLADPAGGPTRYLYLFLRAAGSSFTWRDGYVRMRLDRDAGRWVDRGSFSPADPEKLGVGNTSYGPNLPGDVCDPDGVVRRSADRFPRDGMTVSTPTYRLHASGRWMVRDLRVARPDGHGYGPDVIDRWKGRAFQQSPDSTVSLVGFEDEQVNWEANSALLGWRSGPVRAIREVWGADSGTNVTKTETYYRDADVFAYHVRVHPIPPDGLYTDWDYNPGVATRYYDLARPRGVPVDGVNDDVGNVDSTPLTGPTYFDATDPAFQLPSAVDRPEEVAGPGFGLVYVFEFTGATSLANAAAVPYYRDDACLDDGTGDAPVPRPYPGDPSTDPHVRAGYVAWWRAHGAPAGLTYADLRCDPAAPAGTPPWRRTPFQGAFGQHGIHFFATHDSDNATLGTPVDEISGRQWRFEVPMRRPANVLLRYGADVVAPLRAVVAPYGG